MINLALLEIVCTLILISFGYGSCHARLMEPPSRSSMWRVGFATKRNFNDNALYCGGVQVQWSKNSGKCGICGDPWDMPKPRANEAGGMFGRGIISRKYVAGQVIKAVVDVTTNHRGYFEFRICPNNNPRKEATQECLNQHLLSSAHGSETKYDITNKGAGKVNVHLQLPFRMTCSQCVFQWTYVAGNNWGRCSNGSTGLGCGPQETFRGCADISIERTSETPNVRQHSPLFPQYHRVKNMSSKRPNSLNKARKRYSSSRNAIHQSLLPRNPSKERRHPLSIRHGNEQRMISTIPPLFKKKFFPRSIQLWKVE